MFKRCCLVGKFESFHKGHQELLKKAKEECKEVLVFSIRRFPDPIFSEKERTYTIDGELYECEAGKELDVKIGPRLRFVVG